MLKIGVIGGSGLDSADVLQESHEERALKDMHDIEVSTPYGPPSSSLRVLHLFDKEVYLLARHGREHTIPPSQVNYRANIQALKDRGCDCILATTAVGSLRRRIERGDLVVLDQFIDFTRRRINTFHDQFQPHNPVHTPMADPFHDGLREQFIAAGRKLGLKHHERGTVVTIEGPRFSTRAESHMFRAWGADVINMSVAPECALANEAGLPYAAVAMSTDYDCWKEDEAPVTWEQIVRIFTDNALKVTSLLLETIRNLRI
ncbi:S-methyl-5'-thioadenosine phosphorylase [Desulfovibrio aminophilus]|uniref:S-methyl-5'-thioadenosine phosphorylase n=1 Tax=Desulfovibrio aminophilus TaxID=81425 RepID=UPI003399E32A